MTSTLEYTPKGLYVAGEWVSDTGDVLQVDNPATEEIIGEVPQARLVDVRRAIAAARTAFDEGPWPQMTPIERSRIMARMGEIMTSRFDELVALNIAEAGAVTWQARDLQVKYSIDYWCDMADRVLPQFVFEEAFLPAAGYGLTQGVLRREPAGVAALITAYNFPFQLNLMKLAPALAAGCTTVLKPSPYTPLQALIIAEIAEEAGLPAGVLNVVTGGADVGEELTTSPAVDMISFTGSDAVGSLILRQAAPTFKKTVLELGGKSASIVLEDADIESVSQAVALNFTLHAGQGCSLLTRAFVHESRYDELLGAVLDRLRGMQVGDPADPATDMGPLISAQQRAKVQELVDLGRNSDATLEFGGGSPQELSRGYFVEPTLFTNVDNHDPIAQTEFFGPVGIISKFSDDDEAVRLANDSVYGLGGGVFTNDMDRAYAIAKRVRTGLFNINGLGGWNYNAPTGGFGHSGLGRERGKDGVLEFLEAKSITW